MIGLKLPGAGPGLCEGFKSILQEEKELQVYVVVESDQTDLELV